MNFEIYNTTDSETVCKTYLLFGVLVFSEQKSMVSSVCQFHFVLYIALLECATINNKRDISLRVEKIIP
jgi:hypothetical protein